METSTFSTRLRIASLRPARAKSAPAAKPYLRTPQHYYMGVTFGNALETLLSRVWKEGLS